MKNKNIILILILSIIVIATVVVCAIKHKPNVNDFLSDRGLPTSIEMFNENNYNLLYDQSSQLVAGKDKSLNYKFCRISYNVVGEKIQNKFNNQKECTIYAINKHDEAVLHAEMNIRMLKGAVLLKKIKANLKNNNKA